MVKNPIKLIALDLDGTLLNNEGKVSSYSKQIIQHALGQNIQIVLSTGRPFPFCSHIANQLEATNFLITNNGAEIWKDGKHVVERHYMNPHTIAELWEVGHKKDLLMWMVSPNQLFRKSSRPERFTDYDWLKFGFGNLNKLLADSMYERLAEFDGLEITSSSVQNIEINKKGVNKIEALKRVCGELKISLEHVMAIGDNLNDLQMIKQVGLGVAVDNAVSEIKEFAQFITASNDSDGAAKAIERFVLQ